MTPFSSVASTFFWIVALAVVSARYGHGFDPGWPAMRCCTVLIWSSWLFHMELCLDTIWCTACLRSDDKFSSFKESNEPFVCSSNVAEGNACGNLSGLLFFLPVFERSSIMPRFSRAVSVLLTRYVGLNSADATVCPFRIRRVWFATSVISWRNILCSSVWETPFGQISSCLSNLLSSVVWLPNHKASHGPQPRLGYAPEYWSLLRLESRKKTS